MKKPTFDPKPAFLVAGTIIFALVLVPVIFHAIYNGNDNPNTHVFTSLFNAVSSVKAPIDIQSMVSSMQSQIGAQLPVSTGVVVVDVILSWFLDTFKFFERGFVLGLSFFGMIGNALAVVMQLLWLVLSVPFSSLV